ncbi:citrate synthase [Ruficoccus sp. ZRK36]|uniref:citrate synthase n=1 Tax=Ruficoccus sp. ZRK36 TaxID=2866311 RepID=UPI001C734AAA|nr:citrate synthase [Ruficoccus sp. ZRK36]QYY34664.1 citrate synthase [Ruficoccus sp. ZRK36]
MEDSATIRIANENYTFPLMEGSEGEKAIDTRTLRSKSGYITYDEGYGNTGSCESAITFIDGEKGILRYRGYPIEQLAESSTFIEAAYLIIYGELPQRKQMTEFSGRVLRNARIDVGMHRIFEGFPHSSHPMAMLSAMLNSLGCYYPEMATNNRERDLEYFDEAASLLLSKVRTLSAMTYRMKNGLPFVYPKHSMGYCQNFLHMLFSEPYHDYVPHDDVVKALDLILLLHADHEQNCSTSTVRMVASGGANLFASVSAGVCALWGPLHGGANMAVVSMLQKIHDAGDDGSRFIEAAKRGEARLMGFGHRVYKNYDPRARILGKTCEKVLAALKQNNPLLDIARRLEEKALSDPYFVDRKLYPNVDFYSGIILAAIGLPLDMFTVIFSIGRMPGWIANWKEIAEGGGRIHRPRQIYVGKNQRDYVLMKDRAKNLAPAEGPQITE